MLQDYQGKSQRFNLVLNILQRWKSGDFTRAAHDHNIVWRYLNGNRVLNGMLYLNGQKKAQRL
ncbi:MAG: DUF6241 domain-containing protein [Clostridiales bacterium]|nr:DUF6241 domain-containing protein [Clostridiales bacterium]MCF8021592.1 DUF6241 domain-containing protein [Clostridiales bacterium]